MANSSINWIANVVSDVQSDETSAAAAADAAERAAQAAGMGTVNSYFDQPYAASAQYSSAPFNGWISPEQQYEQMRMAAWQQYYSQQGVDPQQQQFQQHQQQYQQPHYTSAPPPPPIPSNQFQPQNTSITSNSSLPPPPPPPPPPPLQQKSTPAPTQMSWADKFKEAQKRTKNDSTTSTTSSTTASLNQLPPQPSSSQTLLPPPPIVVPEPMSANLSAVPPSGGRGRGGINNQPAWMTQGSSPSLVGGPTPHQQVSSGGTVSGGSSSAKRSRWGNPLPTNPAPSSTPTLPAPTCTFVPPRKMTLAEYTEKCIKLCSDEIDVEQMKLALRERITRAIAQQQVEMDWRLEPPPFTPQVYSSPNDQYYNKNHKKEKKKTQKQNKNQKKKDGAFDSNRGYADEVAQEQMNKRADRFQHDQKLARKRKALESPLVSAAALHASGDDGTMRDHAPIVGTCEVLEKKFFRSTAVPDPSTVRPESVLSLAFESLKNKWKTRNESVEYAWMCDQLKSIRQDLMFQNIRNNFTVLVYESHARIALEEGDLNEFNQCQTQLRDLYADSVLIGCRDEFTAYRILYYVYLKGNDSYTEGSSDLIGILQDLRAPTGGLGKPSGVYDSEAVKHAIEVMLTLLAGNYHSFFTKLYDEAPNMGQYVLDYIVPKQRIAALRTILRAYKPSVLPVSFVATQLGFEVIEGNEGILSYLEAAGIAVVVANTPLSTNDEAQSSTSSSSVAIEQVLKDKYSIETKTCAKTLDLEKLSEWEGTLGNLL